ncbi:MAG: aryl-sulfate sulfotransferase [Pseudomonadota bacterium]
MKDASSPPPVWLTRTVAGFQFLHAPVLRPEKAPDGFPPIEITVNNGAQAGTLLFTPTTNPFSNGTAQFKPFIAEIDKASGTLIAYRRMATKGYLFQPQPEGYSYAKLEHVGVNGAGHDGVHYISNERLETLYSIRSGVEGGTTDTHEFVRSGVNTIMLISYRKRRQDLTALGGAADALVYDPVIVERSLDGETLWLWDGADHVPVYDAVAGPDVHLNVAPPAIVDHAHPNAISIVDSDHILLSLKHQDCVLKIQKSTGDVVWRMGGPASSCNEFTFVEDAMGGFSHQHSVRSLPNGNILLFDNGTLHPVQESRAVEYEINETDKTARLVWSYANGQFSHAQGSVERLQNGNTLIGWGFATRPFVSEVQPDGTPAFEANLPDGQIVYRVYQGPER